uniref:C2H2-type domain-containing protein n=2 Tax=Stomoxys calcitrans TaxID=35570 RepID=A0A1I8Q7F8_STOCA
MNEWYLWFCKSRKKPPPINNLFMLSCTLLLLLQLFNMNNEDETTSTQQGTTEAEPAVEQETRVTETSKPPNTDCVKETNTSEEKANNEITKTNTTIEVLETHREDNNENLKELKDTQNGENDDEEHKEKTQQEEQPYTNSGSCKVLAEKEDGDIESVEDITKDTNQKQETSKEDNKENIENIKIQNVEVESKEINEEDVSNTNGKDAKETKVEDNSSIEKAHLKNVSAENENKKELNSVENQNENLTSHPPKDVAATDNESKESDDVAQQENFDSLEKDSGDNGGKESDSQNENATTTTTGSSKDACTEVKDIESNASKNPNEDSVANSSKCDSADIKDKESNATKNSNEDSRTCPSKDDSADVKDKESNFPKNSIEDSITDSSKDASADKQDSETKQKEAATTLLEDSAPSQDSNDVDNNDSFLNNTNYDLNEENIDEDAEFEDVEAPADGDEELIVPDETENGNSTNAEDEEEEEDEGKISNCVAKSHTEDKLDDKTSAEEEENCYSALEPELVAIEENTKDENSMGEEAPNGNEEDGDESSNITANDPLNCVESQEGSESKAQDSERDSHNEADSNAAAESGNNADAEGVNNNQEVHKDVEKEDEDDEVQFIETRNSPICIESDDDDDDDETSNPPAATKSAELSVVNKRETRSSVNAKSASEHGNKQTINLPTSSISLPKNLTVTRTSARKSTARPPQLPRVSTPPTVVSQSAYNRPKIFQHLNRATFHRRSMPAAPTASGNRQVVDTIDLLDSSDEEGHSSIQAHNRSLPPKFRTPPKRTLMAAKNMNKKSPNKMHITPSHSILPPNSFAAQIRRQQVRKPAPPPLPPPTPQSNFLNAVQLQPATGGVNPPAFSALLSNKSVIIPNAFYGNPPSMRGAGDAELERRYARWLDNFITQFCNPQLVASHSCFVFLQRALKYKDFVHVKSVRTSLNMNAQTATDHLNHQLMMEMRSIFLKSSKEITPHGRRFCELTCSMVQNKSVTLLVHGITNKVILKTCNMEMPTASSTSSSSSNNANSSSSASASSSNNRKRQLDEDEYVPGKDFHKTSNVAAENADQSSGDADGPKRSLRSKRAKRLDNSFSYNEDDLAEYDLEDEEEQAERLAREAVQRKIEKKRMEAQRQRQQQAASFESAFLQTFAKTLGDRPTPTSLPPARHSRTDHRSRASSSVANSMLAHAMHNDAEDMLAATWIENVENEETQVISDDDEPREHRIYKKQEQQRARPRPQPPQQQQQQQHQYQHQQRTSSQKSQQHAPSATHPRHWPKNTDINLVVNSKSKDICVICKLSVQRIVHHYVNEHRGSEVYNSRLSSSQLEQLKRGACNIKNMTLYKNGQPQYEAYCIFCQKDSRFMLPYWCQHFTMHTGEYAYRCSGCGIRKPTRSLLTQHQAQVNGCPEGGNVLQDYLHDVKRVRVEARICTLCNYVQLHRANVVKHLHQQHNIKQILPKHIQTIVLLKDQSEPGPSMPTPEVPPQLNRRQLQRSSTSASNRRIPSYVVDDDDDNTLLFAEDALPPMHQQEQAETAEPASNQYYNYMPPYMMNQNHENFTWEEADPSDDLSFMICGMLDVPE